MVLSYEGVSFVIFDLLSDVFDALNPLGKFWGSLCLLPNWGYFHHFECILEFALTLSTFWEATGDIWIFGFLIY